MSERESGEREILTERRLRRVMSALDGAQSHSSDLRSVAYGSESSGGLRETTATERAIDAGVVGRGRTAWARLSCVTGAAGAALRWLVTYAHVSPDATALSRLYADHAAPMPLRDALAVAVRAREVAAAVYAGKGPKRGETMTADGAAARTSLVNATAREAAAEAALVAWGAAELLAGVVAFERTARQQEAA